jgi:hypothetical protein
MVYLTMAELIILKLIMVQLPMKKLIQIKTNLTMVGFAIKYLLIS